MIRGRFKKAAIATGAGALVAMTSLAIVPLTAGAVGSAPTNTTVTTKPASTTSGRPILVVARVFPVTGVASVSGHAMRFHAHKARAATGNAGVPTGTVTFTITGNDASVVHCKVTDVVNITHTGKASCKIVAEELKAVASPYTILATYSGDTNFAPSVGTTTETVSRARTHTKLRVDSKPKSGTTNTFTAVIRSGPGGSLLSGTVVFSVSDTPSQNKALRTCSNGGDVQPVAVTGNVGAATCVLAAGWFIVPNATHQTPHPHGAWNVTASYSGDGNFLPSVGTKSGHSKS